MPAVRWFSLMFTAGDFMNEILNACDPPHKNIKLSDVIWGEYIYFLKSFTVQNRPPGNKIATTILKTTTQSIYKATSWETRCNKLVKL